MNINPDKLTSTLNLIVRLLVERDFERLEAMSSGDRLTASALRCAVDRYPFALKRPPTPDLAEMLDPARDVCEIENSQPLRWAIDLDLWDDTAERSDLTLSLEVIDGPGELYAFVLNDLHVL